MSETDLVVAGGTRVERILEAHRQIDRCGKDLLGYALLAGAELSDAKEACGHGNWAAWLHANTPQISDRTARVYMQLYHAQRDGMLKTAAAADLGLKDALKLIQKPKEKPPSERETINWLRKLGGDGSTQTVARGEPVTDTLVKFETRERVEWTEQQAGKRSRAVDRLSKALDACDEARGLSEYGAGQLLKDAAIAARQASVLLDDLAASF